jgi:capsular exopolysaccharide synthesis family protein
MMSEGKSFTSINLALSFALNNKRCVLLSFDLRKPKISEYLNLSSEKGISSYLSSDTSLDEIIIPSNYPNLDVILSGPTPPNPMELISGEKTKVFFNQLREKYDFIFIDTPPIGMVADSMLLIKYSDVTIYVVRHNLTLKKVFANVVQNLKKRGIANVNIVINDVPAGKKFLSYSQGYNYAYGYGYGYGYYSSDAKKPKRKESQGRNIFRQIRAKTGFWL